MIAKSYQKAIADIQRFVNEDEPCDFDFDLDDEFIVDNEERSFSYVFFLIIMVI